MYKRQVLDRSSNAGYVSFEGNAEKVAAIAQVFPIFFFLVAALVALTTMTRMVEEERTQIGTLKALGYSRGAIMVKYLLYAGAATVCEMCIRDRWTRREGTGCRSYIWMCWSC